MFLGVYSLSPVSLHIEYSFSGGVIQKGGYADFNYTLTDTELTLIGNLTSGQLLTFHRTLTSHVDGVWNTLISSPNGQPCTHSATFFHFQLMMLINSVSVSLSVARGRSELASQIALTYGFPDTTGTTYTNITAYGGIVNFAPGFANATAGNSFPGNITYTIWRGDLRTLSRLPS